MPSPTELSRCGIHVDASPETSRLDSAWAAASAFAAMGEQTQRDSGRTQAREVTARAGPVQMGAGLLSMPSRLVEKIRRREFVDLAEFPPAAPEGLSPVSNLADQVLIVQAADLKKSQRRIADIAMWVRCFILYTRVVAMDRPDRVPELLAYMDVIIRASQRFVWPSWVEYDTRFRQEAAGDEQRSWAVVDASLYTECFTGQSKRWAVEPTRAKGSEQDKATSSRKKPKLHWEHTAAADGSTPEHPEQICMKFNRFNGDCKFGSKCRYTHACSKCKGPHPVSQCSSKPN